MQSTNKFDCNQKEIFVGDKVIKWWGFVHWQNKQRNIYRWHTIEFHEEKIENGVKQMFLLNNLYNNWDGPEVQKLTDEDLQYLTIQENTSFFYDDDNNVIRYTDQHLMGLSDQDWKKYCDQQAEQELKRWYPEKTK
jgi:hypothetical protein